MDITEVTSSSLQADETNLTGFSFEALPRPTFSQETEAKLNQWGVSPNLSLQRLRFNRPFNHLEVSSFVSDLLQAQTTSQTPAETSETEKTAENGAEKADQAEKAEKSSLLPPLPNISPSRLSCSELNLNLLDCLEERGLVGKEGYIKKTMGELWNGVEIVDKVREALIVQDSDDFDVFDSEKRKELLVYLLRIIVVGGYLNQYDDYITPYRDALKDMYKNLVTVRKDPSSGQLFVDSHVYELNIFDSDSGEDHPLSVCLLIVSPFVRTATILKYEFKETF